MELNSRMQAAAKSLKIYWDGKPCRNGHSNGRYVSTNVCVTCQNASNGAARSSQASKLKAVRMAGLVDVTVQAPPGMEDQVHAFAQSLVLQREAERQTNMARLIKLTNPLA